MNILNKLILFAKNFFFTNPCALCLSGLTSIREIRYGLCEKCFASLKAAEGKSCKFCGIPLISESETCLSCRSGNRHSYDRLRVLFPYSGKYRTLLTEYKFKKNTALADFFAEKVLNVLNDSVLKEAVIVPVPPRQGKIKENGWDQVDYLVKRLFSLSHGSITVCRCLRRKKSKTQKTLGRKERMENLKGRISILGPAPKIAFLIDDVITTGSTMETCSSVLKENGAEKVYGVCLFYD